MGYLDARNDGIRMEKGTNGYTAFFPLCSQCGKEVKSINYIHGLKYLCRNCKLENKLADRERQIEQNAETKERKFANAVKRIEKQTKLSLYKDAIDKVKSKLHTHGYFDSTEEIMVAIELLKNRVGFIHQKKFMRYCLDFVIPSEKIVLEVDGSTFHTEETKKREIIRDDLIVLHYGLDWEVIRITDKLLNKDITKLVPAIKEIKAQRKELKAQHGGILPLWYTDRF